MKIQKAKQVIGKTLILRDATKEDAEFIFSLRTDPVKSRFLSITSPLLKDQYLWLERYENSDDQAYFIIEYENNPIGTVRIYDQKGDSFCWGSWILIDGRPSHAAIESLLMVYSYASYHLGFTSSHFDVRKKNERAWRFYERFGATRVSENDIDFFYSLSGNAINDTLAKHSVFLPNSVTVIR